MSLYLHIVCSSGTFWSSTCILQQTGQNLNESHNTVSHKSKQSDGIRQAMKTRFEFGKSSGQVCQFKADDAKFGNTRKVLLFFLCVNPIFVNIVRFKLWMIHAIGASGFWVSHFLALTSLWLMRLQLMAVEWSQRRPSLANMWPDLCEKLLRIPLPVWVICFGLPGWWHVTTI